MLAAEYKDLNCLTALIEAGADLNVCDKDTGHFLHSESFIFYYKC